MLKEGVGMIFGSPKNMGIGVDIPFLSEVYLSDDPTISVVEHIQNMGRVGRPSQDTPGRVVFPNLETLIKIFNTDFREQLYQDLISGDIYLKSLDKYNKKEILKNNIA
jgi:hypothetical protein